MIDISLDFNFFNNYYYFYERLVILLFSLVPSLLLVWFVLYTDRKNKESKKNIIICLLSGILTTALASYFENLVSSYFSNNIFLIYVWALIEELSKMAIFFLFIFDNKYYDDIYDGLVYMSLIALSFAGIENVMYAFSESTISSSISLSLMRDLTTIPLHVICGIIIGYFLSLGTFSKKKDKRFLNFFYAALYAMIVHGTFNLLMTVLGNINVPNNSLHIFMFQLLPILLIMISLFYIAVKFIKKIVKLNYIYINDKTYEDKYNYLMNYNEYINSNDRKRRLYNNEIITFKKKKGKVDDV